MGKRGPELLVPKIQAVTFGTADDKVYVLNDWPERIAVSVELLRDANSCMLKVDGDLVVVTTENGTAEYRKDGETQSGDWTLKRLAGAVYDAVEWPLKQVGEPDPEPRTPSLAVTKMRQRILKRGIARKSDDNNQTAA